MDQHQHLMGSSLGRAQKRLSTLSQFSNKQTHWCGRKHKRSESDFICGVHIFTPQSKAAQNTHATRVQITEPCDVSPPHPSQKLSLSSPLSHPHLGDKAFTLTDPPIVCNRRLSYTSHLTLTPFDPGNLLKETRRWHKDGYFSVSLRGLCSSPRAAW